MSQPDKPGALLPADVWAGVVRHAPLVSIDLIVRDPGGAVLVGWRTNEPARNQWFVPGGVIRKNETMSNAFRRLCTDELGEPHELAESRLFDVHEHFYDTNFSGDPSFGTHYVVLVRELPVPTRPTALPKAQHTRYTWLTNEQILADDAVHEHVKRYARHPPLTMSG